MGATPVSVELTFVAGLDAEEALQAFMLTHATVEGIEETSDGRIHYCIPISEWNDGLQSELRAFLLPKGSAEFIAAAPLPVQDWNAMWEASIEPLRVTDELVISPSWKLDRARELHSKYLIQIDPKMSFGTGHHETTRLCLQAIESLDVAEKAVLDIGTGSGVLAIYCLLRGAKSAIGIDTDEWAIENVDENKALNGITNASFEIKKGTLESVGLPPKAFDIILANIHRNILVEIADVVAMHSRTNAWLVLSGLLIYDAEEVIERYKAAGFQLERQLRENEWIALVLRYQD